MGRQKSSQTIRCRYYTWKLFRRGAIYYADGRSNATNLGKHSLNSKTEENALQKLQFLDERMARKTGLIPREPEPAVVSDAKAPISIADGWARFIEHCDRPAVMGGVSRNTLKRYRAVRDKHVEFCTQKSIREWSQFGNQQIEQYGRWLDEKKYASRSIYLEMTLIVSVVKWLIDQKLLDAQYRIQATLTKPSGTDTYCYSRQQMARMLEFCQTSESGRWIRPILVALATSGMRIGELIALRWTDIDLASKSIRIADERFSGRKEIRGRNRTTKGKRSRSVPLNPALESVLHELERHSDGYVFHGAKGARLRAKRVLDIFKREIRDALKPEFPVARGEIGFAQGTIHSFRHDFVGKAFRQGATEAEIKDWVGHRSSEMVHHYRHLRPDDSQRRMQSINFISDDTVSSGHQPEPEVPRESQEG